MNRSWRNVLALLIALTVSFSTLGAGSDFALQIFGNANMDENIDEKDVEYVESVINGTNAATNLSDANYDGKVDEMDITQINQIIAKEEKKLTILDDAGRIVTLDMPLKRVVLARMAVDQALVAMGATDRVVGISSDIKDYHPHIAKPGGWMDLPNVGYVYTELDYEKIIELNPDVVFMDEQFVKEVDEKLPDTILVVALSTGVPDTNKVISGFKILGVMFGKESEAEKVINWIQKYDTIIRDRTKDLSPEEQPTFYIEASDWVTYNSEHWDGKAAAECGGRNIADGVDLFIPGENGEYAVSPEWVLEQNPDVIFRRIRAQTDLVSEEKAKARLAEFINRTGWDEINAVKNGQVYLYVAEMNFAPCNIIGRCYFAKFLQPEIFRDINPKEIADEYWNTFIGNEYPEMWVYPEPK